VAMLDESPTPVAVGVHLRMVRRRPADACDNVGGSTTAPGQSRRAPAGPW
jgi:hypothetical protein